MDYDLLIEMNNVTIQDCIALYTRGNIVTEINDGHVINFVKDGD